MLELAATFAAAERRNEVVGRVRLIKLPTGLHVRRLFLQLVLLPAVALRHQVSRELRIFAARLHVEILAGRERVSVRLHDLVLLLASGQIVRAGQGIVARDLDKDGLLRLLHLVQCHVHHRACAEVAGRRGYHDLLCAVRIARLLQLDHLSPLLAGLVWLRGRGFACLRGLAHALRRPFTREALVLHEALPEEFHAVLLDGVVDPVHLVDKDPLRERLLV